jgi:alpha-1,3-glucan synthase
MVSDVVGYLGYGSLPAVGWSCWSLHVSLIPLCTFTCLCGAWNGTHADLSSTCIWLWLGVLDAIQGVGLGMILLQTLSRLHVCATLAGAQLLGSVVVMIARATSPSKLGPGNVFPNLAIWDIATGRNNPFAHWEFWLCLVCQIIIVIGYLYVEILILQSDELTGSVFFRKEQLSKP